MTGKVKKMPLQIVVEDEKPSSVILDIQEYTEMLERLEDLEDLEMLNAMRSRPLEFRRLEDFIEEYYQDV